MDSLRPKICSFNNLYDLTYFFRNDPDAAVRAFETCYRKYYSTPYLEELTRYLIENNEEENLHKVIMFSVDIHGQLNTLYNLMFVYLECDRLNEARTILMVYFWFVLTHRLISSHSDTQMAPPVLCHFCYSQRAVLVSLRRATELIGIRRMITDKKGN